MGDKRPSTIGDIEACTILDMTIQKRLEELLAESGTTQTALAKQVGVKRGAISAIVRGRTKNPRPAHLFLIADALGVEPRWLATGQGPKNKKDAGLSEDQRAWLAMYEHIPASKRQAVRAILDPPGEYDTGGGSANHS